MPVAKTRKSAPKAASKAVLKKAAPKAAAKPQPKAAAVAGKAGLDALRARGLIDVLWGRRTHRVSRGMTVDAGTMSYKSELPHAPLSELEEAMLIAVTGCTGLTMPDRPFTDPATNTPIMAKPNLNMAGRTAGRTL